ncbi:hypothetical protein [Hyphomonas sp.]|uniref:hypothetical protein n=1 Tax=Hyphomonas sp. TaxID=87 RepID=UPI00391C9837
MADGSPLQARFGGAARTLSIDEAIRVLEAGQGDGIAVDLGGGRIARADTPRGADGLLQRLRGHKMLLSQAASGADVARFRSHPPEIQVAPAVREILDAAARRS